MRANGSPMLSRPDALSRMQRTARVPLRLLSRQCLVSERARRSSYTNDSRQPVTPRVVRQCGLRLLSYTCQVTLVSATGLLLKWSNWAGSERFCVNMPDMLSRPDVEHDATVGHASTLNPLGLRFDPCRPPHTTSPVAEPKHAPHVLAPACPCLLLVATPSGNRNPLPLRTLIGHGVPSWCIRLHQDSARRCSRAIGSDDPGRYDGPERCDRRGRPCHGCI